MACLSRYPQPVQQDKITTLEMEIALAGHFNPRVNLIVPNVSWGMFLNHECDLLMVSPAGIITEIEIKVSKSDLKADMEKPHGHNDDKIHKLYFAMPEKMKDCVELIPERAGVLLVTKYVYENEERYRVEVLREAIKNKIEKIDPNFKTDLLRLAAMRTWTLKKQLHKAKQQTLEVKP